MKLSTGCMLSAGLIFAAATADAQVLNANGGGARYSSVSDFDGSYAELPPQALPALPHYGPPLLAPQEVYAVLRASGFQPLGMLRQRGAIYMIAAIAPDGEDGRVIIDGRDRQIIRFVPAFSMGSFDRLAPPMPYAAAPSMEPLPTPSAVRGGPRPPALIPHVASRSVPPPKASPPRAGEVEREALKQAPSEVPKLAAKPPFDKPASEPVQKPMPETQTAGAPQTTGTIDQLKPVPPAILPTQQMPAVQGLD